METTNYMALVGLKKNGSRPDFYRIDKSSYIIQSVCEWFGIEEHQLKSKSRRRKIVSPRQITTALLVRNTDLSYNEIIKIFNQKNHTNVIHSMQTVRDLCDSDEKYKETFDLLERKIQ